MIKKSLKYSFLCLLVSQQIFASTPNLSYQYSVPYSSGGSLTIKNNGPDSVTISSISFNSNANIDGKPWGTLYGWNSTIETVANADGITINYTINESPAITIAPSASAVLTYNISNQYGGPFSPYNAAMNSTDVTVMVATGDGEPTSITPKVEGVCTGDACKYPFNLKALVLSSENYH